MKLLANEATKVQGLYICDVCGEKVKEAYEINKKHAEPFHFCEKCKIKKRPEKLKDGLFPFSAIKDCMNELNSNNKISACETMCGMLLLKNSTAVQVKIVVTKNENDFLGPCDISIQTDGNYRILKVVMNN